jgi:hypothetical protein
MALSDKALLMSPNEKAVASDAGASDKNSRGSSENWVFFGETPKISQGWKLYVSASNANFAATIAAVLPIFKTFSVGGKHAANERVLRKINSGLYGYSQVGKTIVAYIEDEGVLAPMVADLKIVLTPFANSTMLPPFAEPLGAGLPLSYRYGAFYGDEVVLDGIRETDRRTRRSSTLKGIPADPFDHLREPIRSDISLDHLLVGRPVYEVLSQSAKGGVYAALDLASPTFREVILKLGRRNGHILPDGRDGADLIRHEAWFYTQTFECGLREFVPTFDGLFEFDGGAVVVLERVQGENLQKIRQRDGLHLSHVHGALSILERFHKSGLLVGDAKLANFMATPEGMLKIIDFESGSSLKNASHADQHTTFLFTDEALAKNPAIREKLHFLYSILHTDEAISFDERSRIIDLHNVLQIHDCGAGIENSVRDLMWQLLVEADQNSKSATN